MAACTSRAAASMGRSRSNCRTIVVLPRRLVDVISVTPAMRANWRSSGVATEAAMVSGLAPGSEACTWMTGNSTWGSGATGSRRYARMPDSVNAMASSEVAIGRRMNGPDTASALHRAGRPRVGGGRAAHPAGEAVERQVHDRGGVEGEHLREEETA